MTTNGVSFEEEPDIVRVAPLAKKKESVFINTVISLGLAKDSAGAQQVLIIVVVLGFVISILLTVFVNVPHQAKPPTGYDPHLGIMLREYTVLI